jgi:hypothetical protein
MCLAHAGCISPARTIAISRSGDGERASGRVRSTHHGAIATSVASSATCPAAKIGSRRPPGSGHEALAPPRGSPWFLRQEPTNLLVRDHQQLRVDRSHDPAALPLLLGRRARRRACLPLALESLHLRPARIDSRSSASARRPQPRSPGRGRRRARGSESSPPSTPASRGPPALINGRGRRGTAAALLSLSFSTWLWTAAARGMPPVLSPDCSDIALAVDQQLRVRPRRKHAIRRDDVAVAIGHHRERGRRGRAELADRLGRGLRGYWR